MMSFKKRLVYIFSKEKYIETLNKKDNKHADRVESAKEYDGQEVEVYSKRVGRIGDELVFPNWCNCVGAKKI